MIEYKYVIVLLGINTLICIYIMQYLVRTTKETIVFINDLYPVKKYDVGKNLTYYKITKTWIDDEQTN